MGNQSLFESAWLKWSRAVHHAKALKESIDAAPTTNGTADPLVAVRGVYSARRHGFAVYVDEILPIPADWGLVLGDIANNYRSALEHLAWALASRGRTPPSVLSESQQRAISFPIAQNGRHFKDDLERKLPGVTRADIAKVRRNQPYHYGRRLQHSFSILRRLNDRDKHRSTEPIWDRPIQIGIRPAELHDCANPRTGRHVRSDTLKVGAELVFVRVRRTGPEPRLELETRCVAIPSIETGFGLSDWVKQTGLQIGILLGEFQEVPKEIADGARWFPEWRVPGET